jgi:hypothetical protein
MLMVWEPVWKRFDIEKRIEEMNLLWDSVFFTRELRVTNKSILVVETNEKKKSGASRVIKVKYEKSPE